MAKSRLAAFAAIGVFPSAAGAAPPDLQPPTAEEAIRRQCGDSEIRPWRVAAAERISESPATLEIYHPSVPFLD
jgi:hypothetical protein